MRRLPGAGLLPPVFGRRRPYPYGLLVPVANVATRTAADEIRRFLGAWRIRSTVAPYAPRRRGRARAPWTLQVLVFADDAGRARRLVNDWTLPADAPDGQPGP
ncbi:hypothetical protein [Streptomyces griseocarneus]|uniref:hypothetical protein n=1 Tax=Streptomyces griseocarneus TaxID=51201 RepID=UPI00167C4648|nr:hypothetical protein [Streptomyces griseocarneus]MBZ6477135.1 hypothetical protein [Streptomyces griseocarneus]GHG53748.1 hypothetical protein GCM10018779_15950 [Streptomyces griseocarneus]